MLLLEKINDLKGINSLSKHEQIVHGIIDAIDTEVLKVGDKLPSINEMVADIGYARKTIVKAYTELKERGLVESKNIKGYFIISTETNITLKVALVLYAFHSFQEDFYNTFREELGNRFQIDVFFHHNNETIFNTIIDNIYQKYGLYVVAPIQDNNIIPNLLRFTPDRLLVVDRYLNMPEEYSYVTQDFEETTYQNLAQLSNEIQNYKKIIFFFKENSSVPKGILNAFIRFAEEFTVAYQILETYTPGTLEKNTAYFSVDKTYLWQVIKDAKSLDYTLGKDIGILAHDDTIVNEIAFGGITTISTDFKEMASKAVHFVKHRDPIHEIIPSRLQKRNSF